MKTNLDTFFGKETVGHTIDLYKYLQLQLIPTKETGISHRVLNYWHGLGMLIESREDRTWNRFSITEYIWLKLIQELRKIDFPVKTNVELRKNLCREISSKQLFENLKKNKNLIDSLRLDEKQKKELFIYINAEGYKKEEVKFTFLHLLIVESIIKRKAIGIAIFNDGTWLPVDESSAEYYAKEDKEKLTFETHVVVSISKIVKEFLESENSTFAIPRAKRLSEQESKLLDIINKGEYQSVTIHFKDKKIKSLEMTKKQDVRKKIVEVLAEGSYQDITIKKHKGIVTTIENTVKVKL